MARSRLFFVFLNLFALFFVPSSDVLAAEVALVTAEPVPLEAGSSPAGFKNADVHFSGKILTGDGKKVVKLVDQFMKAEYPDSDFGSIPGRIVLHLDSEGNNYNTALALGSYTISHGIATVIDRNSFCLSACAFLFLAGTSIQPYMDPEIDRTFHIGGQLEFHSPFPRIAGGKVDTFAQGKAAITKLRAALGSALPEDLFQLAMSKAPADAVKVEYVWDALRWNIDLTGYRRRAPTRAHLLNACLNGARWRWRVSYGPFSGLDLWKEMESRQGYTNDFYLSERSDGTGVRGSDGEPIPAKDYILPDENDPWLVDLRKTYNAPAYLKLIDLGNGNFGTQFAFDAGDTAHAYWCSVWTNDEYGLIVVPKKVEINNRTVALYQSAASPVAWRLPYWLEYPAGRTLNATESIRTP
jgi:hypothetical protein